MSLETEEIFTVGFEGESLVLFRQRTEGGAWAYGCRADSSTLLEMMDDDEAGKIRTAQEASAEILYPTFEAMVQHLSPENVYGLPHCVRPEFRSEVWEWYCRSLKELPIERMRRRSLEVRKEQWRRACSEGDRIDSSDMTVTEDN